MRCASCKTVNAMMIAKIIVWIGHLIF
ncbi:hypothetical protein DHT93_08965 [Streptococcus australis]|nr:hypothetical protein [Streptococcus sp. BIOML-A1]RGM72075.1 hypothetical protein DXB95_08755 [Streptococcus ilei]RXV51404.1 hypothetical protein DHT93_08965 [Streptococcus australis]RYS59288.1 hypothetical protein EAI95_09240 [Streptococcus sp. bf_0095]